jgi:hypothetical protein
MEGRIKKKPGQIPAVAEVVIKKFGFEIGKTQIPNRAWKRHDAAWKRGAPGRSARQEARLQRHKRITKMRHVANKLQRESRRLLRRALQG